MSFYKGTSKAWQGFIRVRNLKDLQGSGLRVSFLWTRLEGRCVMNSGA